MEEKFEIWAFLKFRDCRDLFRNLLIRAAVRQGLNKGKICALGKGHWWLGGGKAMLSETKALSFWERLESYYSIVWYWRDDMEYI